MPANGGDGARCECTNRWGRTFKSCPNEPSLNVAYAKLATTRNTATPASVIMTRFGDSAEANLHLTRTLVQASGGRFRIFVEFVGRVDQEASLRGRFRCIAKADVVITLMLGVEERRLSSSGRILDFPDPKGHRERLPVAIHAPQVAPASPEPMCARTRPFLLWARRGMGIKSSSESSVGDGSSALGVSGSSLGDSLMFETYGASGTFSSADRKSSKRSADYRSVRAQAWRLAGGLQKPMVVK